MRRVGLEPTRPKAVTGSLVLRVCQFRHPRSTQELVYHEEEALSILFNYFLKSFELFYTCKVFSTLSKISYKEVCKEG